MWGTAFRQTAKRATFTITVGNDSNQTWKRVILKDTLDTTLVTPVLKNNVYVDSVLNGKWSFRNKVFTLELGDIAPNEKRVVKITVEFKTDAAARRTPILPQLRVTTVRLRAARRRLRWFRLVRPVHRC